MPAKQEAGKMPTVSSWKRWMHVFQVCVLLAYALVGWLRLYNSLRFWSYLQELGIWPRPLYLALSGGAIGLGFLMASFLLAIHSRVSVRVVRIICLLFLVWFWADRIWFSDQQAFILQLPISILISLVTVLLILFIIPPVSAAEGVKQHEQ